jgi:hypothetical protein
MIFKRTIYKNKVAAEFFVGAEALHNHTIDNRRTTNQSRNWHPFARTADHWHLLNAIQVLDSILAQKDQKLKCATARHVRWRRQFKARGAHSVFARQLEQPSCTLTPN